MFDLKIFFNLSKQDRDQNARQSVDALEQIYGYMTFNHGRFGALGNWKRLYFLRQVECSNRKTLQYFGPIELDDSCLCVSKSILNA
jgi:hypothetical protein